MDAFEKLWRERPADNKTVMEICRWFYEQGFNAGDAQGYWDGWDAGSHLQDLPRPPRPGGSPPIRVTSAQWRRILHNLAHGPKEVPPELPTSLGYEDIDDPH